MDLSRRLTDSFLGRNLGIENVVQVHLVSAKTNYGMKDLLESIQVGDCQGVTHGMSLTCDNPSDIDKAEIFV